MRNQALSKLSKRNLFRIFIYLFIYLFRIVQEMNDSQSVSGIEVTQTIIWTCLVLGFFRHLQEKNLTGSGENCAFARKKKRINSSIGNWHHHMHATLTQFLVEAFFSNLTYQMFNDAYD